MLKGISHHPLLDIIRRFPQCIATPLILPDKEDPGRFRQLPSIPRNNCRRRRMRANRGGRGILQIRVACPTSTSTHPHTIVKARSENPLLSNSVSERIADVGAPRTAMDSSEMNDGCEIDWCIIHLVAACRTASPKQIQGIVRDGKVREVRRASKVIRLVDLLANGRGPVTAICGVREPNVIGAIAIGVLGEPGQIESAAEFLEDWCGRCLETCSDENR